MNISRRFTLLATCTLLVVAIPLQASAERRRAPQPTGQQQTQEFVDARMHETLASIDRSLTTLVTITRGGDAARKPGIIGPTVAGANGVPRAAMKPDPAPMPPIDRSILSKKVQIQWNGSADELLRSLSNQLGFAYKKTTTTSPRVRLEGEHMTVEQTLNEIAKQIHGQADIVVSLSNRTITLAKR